MRPVALTLSLALVAGLSADAFAQCCGQPTVAFSPVITAAPAPVVAQTTTVDSWYPGRAIANFSRNLFGGSTTTTTFAAPTTGFATPTTVGFAPTYSVGYAPTPYMAGFAPAFATTAYRPTYPATWGTVQTVSRPVMLSPVVQAPVVQAAACNACDACGGVAQASYVGAPSSTCSSCSAGGSTDYVVPSSGYESSAIVEPRPELAPTENPPATRLRPELDDTDSILDENESKIETDPTSTSDYFNAPPLFAPPANRVTQNTHPAPVHTAVYRQPVENRPVSQATVKTQHLSADGWASAD